MAKGLDKLEPISSTPREIRGLDYGFNFGYGRRYTAGDPLLEALRARLEPKTARLAGEPPASP